MLKIGNNEFVFETSLLLQPGEVATSIPSSAAGLTFSLIMGKDEPLRSTIEQAFSHSIDEGKITLSFPYLQGHQSLSANIALETNRGAMDFRFALSRIGSHIHLQLQGYWVR